MRSIHKEFTVGISSEEAYQKFIDGFNDWWPAEYTWSQDKLVKIFIERKLDGLCTEIGPHGFRCDWGRITAFEPGKEIEIKWQISPKREPIPDPDKASDLRIIFQEKGASTTIQFKHYNFDNHGEGAEEYVNMMDSQYGWDYILDRFKKYCEQN